MTFERTLIYVYVKQDCKFAPSITEYYKYYPVPFSYTLGLPDQIPGVLTPAIPTTNIGNLVADTISQTMTSGINSYYFYFPYFTSTPANSVVYAADNIAKWNLQVSNGGPATNYGWVGTCDPNMEIISVKDLGTGITYTPSAGGVFQLGYWAGTKNFEIKANYNGCQRDSIKLLTGWSCTGYPATPCESECKTSKSYLTVIPQPGEIDLNVAASSPSINLCSNITYTLTGKDTQIGSVYDVFTRMDIPPGMTVVPGTSQLSYPKGSAYVAVADPTVVGTQLEWNISASNATIGTNGIKGTAQSNTTLQEFDLKVQFYVSCGFISGQIIDFSMEADNGCGQPTGDSEAVTPQVNLNGAAPSYGNLVTLVGSQIKPCEDPNTLTVRVRNGGPANWGDADSVYVTLPAGITYVSGSFVAISANAPVNGVPVVRTVNGKTVLIWKLPAGVAPTGVSEFSFQYNADEDVLACGKIKFKADTRIYVPLICQADGSVCNTPSISGQTTLNATVVKPTLTVSNMVATSVANPPNGETVTVSYDITTNSATPLPAGSTATLAVYFDADNSGTYTTGDVLLDSDANVPFSISSSSPATYTGTFNVLAGQACRLLAVVTPNTTCVCGAASTKLPIPRATFAGADVSICSNQTVQIGHDPVSGYSYSWSPTSYLNDNNLSNPTVNTGQLYSTYVQNYILTTDRIYCTSADTTKVTVSPAPTIPDYIANTCAGSCVYAYLNYYNNTWYTWYNNDGTNNPGTDSIPNVNYYSGGPESGPYAYYMNRCYSETEIGTFKYKVIAHNGACADEAKVEISVAPPLVASAGSNEEICGDAEITLGGTPQQNVVYSWSGSSSPSGYTFSSNLPNPVVNLTNDNGSTTYYFNLYVSRPGTTCNYYASKTVKLIAPPKDYTTSNSTCQGDVAYIDAYNNALPGGSSTATYQWYNANGAGNPTTDIIPDATSYYLYTPALTGTGPYKYRVVVTDGECSGEAIVTVTIKPKPVVTTTDFEICNQTTGVFYLGVTPDPLVSYYWYWYDAQGYHYSYDANPLVSVTGYGPGSVIYIYGQHSKNGCYLYTTTAVKFKAPPASGPYDFYYCQGEKSNPILDAHNWQVPGGFTTAHYTWYNDNGSANPNTNVVSGVTTYQYTIDTTNLAAGDYKYRVVIDDGACSGEVFINFKVNPRPTLPSGSINLSCTQSTLDLGAITNYNTYFSLYSLDYNYYFGSSPVNLYELYYYISPYYYGGIPLPDSLRVDMYDYSTNCSNSIKVALNVDTTHASLQVNSNTVLDCNNTQLQLFAESNLDGFQPYWYTNDYSVYYDYSNPLYVSDTNTYNVVANSYYNYYTWAGVNVCSDTLPIKVTRDIAPPVTEINTITLTCANLIDTARVAETSGLTDLSYQWTTYDGNITSDATLEKISLDVPGTYMVTVTNNANGCTTTTETIVSEDKANPTATIQTPAVLTCSTTSITLSGSGSTTGTGVAYAWVASGGATASNITAGGNTLAPTVNAAGTYTLTVTGANGCTATESLNVSENTTPPNVSAGAGQTITCAVQTVQLDGSSTTADATYNWTASGTANATNITAGGATLTPTVNAAGTYTLTVTDPSNGCTATASVSVSIDASVPNANAGTTKTLTCTTTSIALSGSSSTSGATYGWTASNGATASNITAGGATLTPTVNAAGTYTLAVTSSNGCTATSSVQVLLNNTLPTASAGATKTITCSSPTVQLSGTSNAPIATYSWVASGGANASNITAGGATLTPTVNAAGTYTLTVTNTANGCTNTASVSISLNTNRPNVGSLSNKVITCANTQVVLNGVSTTPGAIFAWTGPNGFTSTQAQPTVNQQGAYTLTVTDPANGCSATASLSVSLNNTLPDANAGTDKVITCSVQSVQLNGSSTTANATYTWNGPGGYTSVLQNPVVSNSGTYILTVTAQNGCTTTDAVLVTSNTGMSNMTVVANSPCLNGTLMFNISGTQTGYTYAWSGPGAFSSTMQNPQIPNISANNAGTYTVTITGTNGCKVVRTVAAVIEQCCAAEAGNISIIDPTLCVGDKIQASTSVILPKLNYDFYYLLVNNQTGIIVEKIMATNNTPITFNTTTAAMYTVYGFMLKTGVGTAPTITVGTTTINDLLAGTNSNNSNYNTPNCYDLSGNNAQVGIPAPFSVLQQSGNSEEGNQGGISPFNYNIHDIYVLGGTPPYNYSWSNTNFVKPGIQEATDASHTLTLPNGTVVNGPGTNVEIIYADNATWHLTITDANGCTNTLLVFSNDAGSSGQTDTIGGKILDIDNYQIKGNVLNQQNGAVRICVSGGEVGCVPSFQWSGPQSWTNTAPASAPGMTTGTTAPGACGTGTTAYNLTGLPTGWYSVTVTCGNQTTEGWYWVPKKRPGRGGKDDLGGAYIDAYPNPFSNVTNIGFISGATGETVVNLYSIDGKKMVELYKGETIENEAYTIQLEATNLANGVYIVTLQQADGNIITQKIVLNK